MFWEKKQKKFENLTISNCVIDWFGYLVRIIHAVLISYPNHKSWHSWCSKSRGADWTRSTALTSALGRSWRKKSEVFGHGVKTFFSNLPDWLRGQRAPWLQEKNKITVCTGKHDAAVYSHGQDTSPPMPARPFWHKWVNGLSGLNGSIFHFTAT